MKKTCLVLISILFFISTVLYSTMTFAEMPTPPKVVITPPTVNEISTGKGVLKSSNSKDAKNQKDLKEKNKRRARGEID